MVPRKFNALVKAHSRVNNPEEDADGKPKADKPQMGFIDQVI